MLKTSVQKKSGWAWYALKIHTSFLPMISFFYKLIYFFLLLSQPSKFPFLPAYFLTFLYSLH